MEPLVVIIGPTAVGKTALGIELAKKFNGEIISGDSMQIYRGMDIGTAKPSKEEMAGIPHHMIDILNPDEEFSVALFQEKVSGIISELNSRGKLPLLVGGTGLYVGSIIDHYDFTNVGYDQEFREQMQNLAQEKGGEYILNELTKIDPKAAAKLHPNNIRRIIRALEVFHVSGERISDYQYKQENQVPKYNLVMIGLNMDRAKLYERINLRVDKMVEQGLVEEVKSLLETGYDPESQALEGIGYKEIIPYLNGQCDLEEALYLIKRDTRHFAKRQLTWFRRDQRINWYDVEQYQNIVELAEEIGNRIAGQIVGDVEIN